MVYQWKKGSYINADPEVAGKMCEELEKSGELTAQKLLQANKPVDAPLHDEFEWDDSVAAESYRLEQARHIINCLVTVKENSAEPVRAFFNIVRQSPNYQHIETILRSSDTTELLLKTALSELVAFQRKYSQLKELAPVFVAIDSVKGETT